MVDKNTGRSRGFGFVSFSKISAAKGAIRNINGYVLGHKRLKVEQKKEKMAYRGSSHYNVGDVRGPFDQISTSYSNKTNTTAVDSVTPQEAQLLLAIRENYPRSTHDNNNNNNNNNNKNRSSSNSPACIDDETLIRKIRECFSPTEN